MNNNLTGFDYLKSLLSKEVLDKEELYELLLFRTSKETDKIVSGYVKQRQDNEEFFKSLLNIASTHFSSDARTCAAFSIKEMSIKLIESYKKDLKKLKEQEDEYPHMVTGVKKALKRLKKETREPEDREGL